LSDNDRKIREIAEMGKKMAEKMGDANKELRG